MTTHHNGESVITETQDAQNRAALERYRPLLRQAELDYAEARDRMHALRGMCDALTLLVQLHADRVDPDGGAA